MPSPRYALVTHVHGPAAEFVEKLQRDLHPEIPRLAAHLTVLPPRMLRGTEDEALQVVADICRQSAPFELALGGVETFLPVTPTVYVRVEHAAAQMHLLHDQLNTQALACTEEWVYVPHLTIMKMETAPQAEQVLAIARERWAAYEGSRHIFVEELTFVREESKNCWVDLAPVPLGRSLVSR
jgi:2'-5' RNA ligase